MHGKLSGVVQAVLKPRLPVNLAQSFNHFLMLSAALYRSLTELKVTFASYIEHSNNSLSSMR